MIVFSRDSTWSRLIFPPTITSISQYPRPQMFHSEQKLWNKDGTFSFHFYFAFGSLPQVVVNASATPHRLEQCKAQCSSISIICDQPPSPGNQASQSNASIFSLSTFHHEARAWPRWRARPSLPVPSFFDKRSWLISAAWPNHRKRRIDGRNNTKVMTMEKHAYTHGRPIFSLSRLEVCIETVFRIVASRTCISAPRIFKSHGTKIRSFFAPIQQLKFSCKNETLKNTLEFQVDFLFVDAVSFLLELLL